MSKLTKSEMMDRAMEIVMADEMTGICTACGNEQDAEPDARDYECEACGEPCVMGAEEFLIAMGG